MFRNLRLLLRDKRYRVKTAILLIIFLTAIAATIIFIILSFTPIVKTKGSEGFQVEYVISLVIAVVALFFLVNLLSIYATRENLIDGDELQNQNEYASSSTLLSESSLVTTAYQGESIPTDTSTPVLRTRNATAKTSNADGRTSTNVNVPRRNSNSPCVVRRLANIDFFGKRVWLTKYELDVAYALIAIRKKMDELAAKIEEYSSLVREFFVQWAWI